MQQMSPAGLPDYSNCCNYVECIFDLRLQYSFFPYFSRAFSSFTAIYKKIAAVNGLYISFKHCIVEE